MRARLVSAAVMVALSGSAAAAQPAGQMRCEFTRAYSCHATGCFDATTPKAWSVIDWGRKDYAMCDPSGCQHKAFQDWQDGIYRSLTFVGSDLMFKLNLTDMSAVETGTMLNASVTSFGSCASIASPP
jgi:hypothetical protein